MADPYTPDEMLREISFQYIIDAHQLSTQAEIILNDSDLQRYCRYHIGYLSKISVMLHMSIECSLKAMLCAVRIGTAPDEAYWTLIRRSQHRLDTLMERIPDIDSMLDATDICSRLAPLSEKGVSERYCCDVSSESHCMDKYNIDEAELEQRISDTHALLETANDLRRRVCDYRQKAFKKQRVLAPSAVREALKRIMEHT